MGSTWTRSCKTAISPPKDHPSTSPMTNPITLFLAHHDNNLIFSYVE